MHLTPTVALAALLLAGADAAKLTPQGCYQNVIPPLEDMGPYDFQSSGWCGDLCTNATKPVMALFRGSNCLCGDELPPESEKTDEEECTTSCNGFPDEYCGGIEAYGVFLTGLLARVPIYGNDSSSRTSATNTPTANPINSETATPTTAPSEGGGPNKAAIAAGVVVGVIAIAGIAGGAFFFLKYRKRKEVVEEYRRNATINSFVSGGKPYNESSSDSRLDSNLMSQRRQSNGSIADDQDFSRRILKVTNPDGY